MPYAMNDGVRIYYEREGSGPPLVLQHGFTRSLEGWRDSGYVDALKDTYDLILVDARGHGRSDKPHDSADYVLDKRVGDILAVMDDADRLASAKQYIARLKGFYIHAAVFAVVVLGLLGLNLSLGRPYWVIWVFLGWGLGLVGHAILAFGQRSGFVAAWEARKLRELMHQKPKG